MSQIGALGNQDHNYPAVSRQQNVSEENSVNPEPKDKVEISKTREVIEKVIGTPVALVSSAANTVGGFISGGFTGVSKGSEARTAQEFTAGLAYVGMGVAAGVALLGGGWIPALAMGAAGIVVASMAGGSGASKNIGKAIDKSVLELVADNQESGRKLKDGVRDFTEGAFAGAGVGMKEGFKEGIDMGAGVVSGVIEGAKGIASAVVGSYEKEEQKTDAPKLSFFKKLMKAPRAILGTAVGLAGGVVGMALETADGALQGLTAAKSSEFDASKRFHRFMVRLETAIAGTATGLMMGGPWGAAIGLGTGLVTGQLILRAEKKSGKDQEMMDNLTNAINHAQKDNTYVDDSSDHYGKDKTPYETFRDGIEGSATGTAAGAREGFKSGFAAGKGVVDGVFDGIGGIFGAVTGK